MKNDRKCRVRSQLPSVLKRLSHETILEIKKHDMQDYWKNKHAKKKELRKKIYRKIISGKENKVHEKRIRRAVRNFRITRH
jgi:hypothetical protein